MRPRIWRRSRVIARLGAGLQAYFLVSQPTDFGLRYMHLGFIARNWASLYASALHYMLLGRVTRIHVNQPEIMTYHTYYLSVVLVVVVGRLS